MSYSELTHVDLGGTILNDAGWEALKAFPECPPVVFNNIKEALRLGIIAYNTEVLRKQKPVAWQGIVGHLVYDVRALLPSTRHLAKPLYAAPAPAVPAPNTPAECELLAFYRANRTVLNGAPGELVEVGQCCYGGPKPKRDCASCAAWKPVAPVPAGVSIATPEAIARAVNWPAATAEAFEINRMSRLIAADPKMTATAVPATSVPDILNALRDVLFESARPDVPSERLECPEEWSDEHKRTFSRWVQDEMQNNARRSIIKRARALLQSTPQSPAAPAPNVPDDLAATIRRKFTSGNSVQVESIRISRDEARALLQSADHSVDAPEKEFRTSTKDSGV